MFFSEDLEQIGILSFADCISLRSVSFVNKSNLIKLNHKCFRNTSLEYFMLPQTISAIGCEAFSFCPHLVLDIDENNMYYKLIEQCLYNIETTIICSYSCYSKNTSFTIPETVTCIRSSCFVGAYNLKELILPSNLTFIMGFSIAFTSIKKLIIPCTVTSILECAFASNKMLEYVDLGGSFKVIPMNLFTNCTSLKNLNIHDKVKTIKAHAFDNCDSLVCINAPKTLYAALRKMVPLRVLNNDRCQYLSNYILIFWKKDSAKLRE